MQVRPGRRARHADVADAVAPAHALPLAAADSGLVDVERRDPQAVVDDDRLAVHLERAREHDPAMVGRDDRRARIGGDVQPPVVADVTPVPDPLHAERRGIPSLGREAEVAVPELVRRLRTQRPADQRQLLRASGVAVQPLRGARHLQPLDLQGRAAHRDPLLQHPFAAVGRAIVQPYPVLPDPLLDLHRDDPPPLGADPVDRVRVPIPRQSQPAFGR